MKPKSQTSPLPVAALLAALLAGCSDKEADIPDAAPLPTNAAATGQTQAPVDPAESAAFDSRLADVQAALKAREFQRSAEALITLQRAQLNEQQAAAAAAQMRQLQSGLADAVASGDPRAKAAADYLRQSATRR